MTSRTPFISGRTGPGSAFVSDRSGATHDRFMRLSSLVLLPLGVAVALVLASLVGKPYAEARAIIEQPLPALALIAFIIIGMAHACIGAGSIIMDYVHDKRQKALALVANTIAAILIAALWAVAIGLIAASR
jgi:succinate dehydrogenase / fumarate reductase, membrane anchor subunit